MVTKPELIDREDLIKRIYLMHGKVALIAQHYGVSTRTIYNYCDRYATVKAALDDAQNHAMEVLVDTAETKLQQAVIQGQRWAVNHVLNNSAAARKRGWGQRIQGEITGANGKPLEMSHSGTLSVEPKVNAETITGVLGLLRAINAFDAGFPDIEDQESSKAVLPR